jgi:hypothetical protein
MQQRSEELSEERARHESTGDESAFGIEGPSLCGIGLRVHFKLKIFILFFDVAKNG